MKMMPLDKLYKDVSESREGISLIFRRITSMTSILKVEQDEGKRQYSYYLSAVNR